MRKSRLWDSQASEQTDAGEHPLICVGNRQMPTKSGRNLFELLQAKRRLAKYYYKPSGLTQIMCSFTLQ